MLSAATGLLETNLPFPRVARGKVRDIYETPAGLLLVATDRLSAFDVIFSDAIPRKGEVLNRLSAFWFERTGHIVSNHLISGEPAALIGCDTHDPQLAGRASLCRRAMPLPIECVVRGYLDGSALSDYVRTQSVCGIRLPKGLQRRSRLPHPIFTPTTKAVSGHDEAITFNQVVKMIGVEKAEFIRYKSLELFSFAHDRLIRKGIVVSDTKFEFGETDDGVILIDEALTPDSSRFWEGEGFKPGEEYRSMDKQFVRDYVENIGWDKIPPAPNLPPEIIRGMTQRYCEIFKMVTGMDLEQGKEAAN